MYGGQTGQRIVIVEVRNEIRTTSLIEVDFGCLSERIIGINGLVTAIPNVLFQPPVRIVVVCTGFTVGACFLCEITSGIVSVV